jgi:Ser/Thr protein kinase RdoA (MazF antagonist)
VNPQDSVSNEVLAEKIVGLTAEVGRMREDLRDQSATYVRKTEWDLRASAHDREIVHLRSDITEMKAEATATRTLAEQRRPQWPAIVSAVVALVAVILTIIAFAQ